MRKLSGLGELVRVDLADSDLQLLASVQKHECFTSSQTRFRYTSVTTP